MQDVPQIEAFSIPLHVELTKLLGFDFDLVQNCALRLSLASPFCSAPHSPILFHPPQIPTPRRHVVFTLCEVGLGIGTL